MMKAKDFLLLNQNDKKTSLIDYQGKWVILYFYPKDDTPGCTVEACDFTNLSSELSKCSASVVGVSPDTTESHRKFIEKHSLKIDLLSDETKEVLKDYQAWGIKKNYGKEYEGVIRSTYIIDPNGMIKASWNNVRAKGHAERVFEKLKELQS
jgi:thioredoxin-dependent peroxiredoxin